MKYFILVSASHNSGKTTLLRILIDKLWHGRQSGFLVHETTPDNDIFAAADYCGTKVGVITRGDPTTEGEVKEYLTKFIDLGCDIIVGATRTKGAVLDLYKEYIKAHDANMIRISPIHMDRDDTGLRDKLNDITSMSILKIINTLVRQ